MKAWSFQTDHAVQTPSKPGTSPDPRPLHWTRYLHHKDTEQALKTLTSHHSKNRYLQVQFLPPDHQALETVATLNNKCTYGTDIQHFGPASYHQSLNWAVYGLSSCSCWSTSHTSPAPACFYLHQSWNFVLPSWFGGGRVQFVVCPAPYVTLHNLARYQSWSTKNRCRCRCSLWPMGKYHPLVTP